MTDADTYTARIWIAGSYDDAVRTVREFCEEGACFAVIRCDQDHIEVTCFISGGGGAT